MDKKKYIFKDAQLLPNQKKKKNDIVEMLP